MRIPRLVARDGCGRILVDRGSDGGGAAILLVARCRARPGFAGTVYRLGARGRQLGVSVDDPRPGSARRGAGTRRPDRTLTARFGQGIADQRREIAKGLEESVDTLNKAGINPQEASALIVITQHYDTLQSIGADSSSNLILLPNNPNAASSMLNDMTASLLAANKINEMENKKRKS